MMYEPSEKERKDGFCAHAFAYFVKNGLENTSVRELCREMKLSYGSLYYWFKDKDDIYISTAMYGFEKVVDELFEFAFSNLDNLDDFFEKTPDEIKKNFAELRTVYQVAASPVYGARMRKKAEDLMPSYERYIKKLAENFDCSQEQLTPLVFVFISIIMDYCIWEDERNTRMQLDYLYNRLKEEIGSI